MEAEDPPAPAAGPGSGGIARGGLDALPAAILNALPAHVALLDRDGVILTVNEAWRRFASENALPDTAAGVGQNYLAVCERADTAEARQAAAGIRSVLRGAVPRFELEYPW
jgi:PAS domain-containing protein